MTRATKRPPGIPLLALALVLAPAGLAACTPRPDEPAPPASSASGAPPAAATASTGEAGGEVEGSGEESEAEEEPVLVRIEGIDVAVLKSFPVQIHAVLRGYLSDPCVEAGEALVSRDGNTFTVTIPAERPPGRMCAQVLVPFERSVPLPVRDLPKGEYRIEAHGASATFTLDRDNSFNPR
jgi:inhibitor of cysteine peptidase